MIYDTPGIPQQTGVTATAATLDHLRRTKPWVRFISVMCFIGGALLLVAGFLFAVIGSSIPGLGNAGLRGVTGVLLGGVYLLLALLYIFPGLYLWRYADAIASLIRSPQSLALEEAMRNQASFWRLVGILTAIVVTLYLIFFAFFVVFGTLGALLGR